MQYFLCLLFFHFIILMGEVEASLTLPAFCRKTSEVSSPYHPLKFPEPHIPWVWEAVHDPVTQNVDVTFILGVACHFNQTQWVEVSERFPQYGKFFSYGKKENLLVDAKPDFEDEFVNNMLDKQLGCVYWKDNKMVANVKSVPFAARRPYMGPMLIRCPTNGVGEFDSLQIEVEPPKNKQYTTVRTEKFSVCTVPTYQPQHKQFNLSIVTATSRDNSNQLIEWIEYHLLLGVSHFFIYNTAAAKSETQQKISKVLQLYTQRNVVTEVLWPYKNCLMEGMAKGRYTRYMDPNSGGETFFKPPCPIAAYGAHASAYARFRHTSKYIIYVDDDEFLSLTNQLHAHEYNVQYVADHIFARHPKAPSIAFMPIAMNSCPMRDAEAAANRKEEGSSSDAMRALSANDATVPEQLPRVYNKRYGRIGQTFEYKQLLRTDVVALFSVHYLALLESQLNPQIASGSEPFFVRIQHGAVLHYQVPAQESGDPFSYVDFLPIEVLPQVTECHSSVDMRVSLYPENVVQANAVGFYSQKVLNHLMPPHLYEQLKIRYRDARKEIGL